MKKTIFSIGRALPCLFFMAITKRKGHVPSNRKIQTFCINSNNTLKILSALAHSELKFERLLRKRAFRILSIIMFLSASSSFAQNSMSNEQLNIGDKIPALNLYNVLNYSDSSIVLSKFRGKALILDFWATYCSPCVAEFPKMDAMQKRHGKNIQILLINTYSSDTREVLEKFLVEQRKKITGFSLPFVVYNPKIKEVFQVRSMPHYVWIGTDGRIKAITRADQLTEENVAKHVAGLSLNLQTKKD